MRWIAILAVALAVSGAEAATDKQCDRMLRRYERQCSTPTPSPTPTRSPQPTVSPLPCEGVGRKTYQPGEKKMLCWDVPTSGGVVIIESVNAGNASCGQYMATMVGPDGSTYDSVGAQPMGTLSRIAGRYYFATQHVWGDPPCNTLTFSVR